MTHNDKAARFTSRSFATAAIACYAYSLLILLLMHVLRPDYAPVNHMISDYAVGRWGWLWTTGFLAMSCGCLMLMLGMARSRPGSVASWIGTLLLIIPVIGLVVSAIYPTDLEDAPSTQTGAVHNISFLVNVCSIFLVTVLLSVGFWRQPRWRSHRRMALTLSALIVAAFVLQFLTLRRGLPYGLANRFFVAVLFAWFFATSFRLRGLARE